MARFSPKAAATRTTSDRWSVVTHVAFVLAVGLAVARTTITEYLRAPMDISPGAELAPRAPGPATSLGIDLLLCVPALLVLARRVGDPSYRLRHFWSAALAGGLALWTAASVGWSADKFAALVGAADLIGSLAMLWAAAQLVRTWLRLRIVAAATLGLLLLQVAAGLEYRYLEYPALKQQWEAGRHEFLRQRGWSEDSFLARQFGNKVNSGEITGFTHSANTYAALVVMLGVAALGIAIHKGAISRRWAGPLLVSVVVLGTGAIALRYTYSRAAMVTPLLAAAVLGLLAMPRVQQVMLRRGRLIYFGVLAAFVLGAAAVAAHGWYHGSLGEKSLTFRWYYWTGAARMVAAHPLAGVGWRNFGQYYTQVRPPQAPEEVKDPHNIFVRGFAELGIVGGALLLAWLLRLAWELTRPLAPPESPARPGATLRTAVAIALVAMGLSAWWAIDWSPATDAGAALIVLELLKRFAGLLLLAVAMALGAARWLRNSELDDRPAPWILRSLTVAMGVLLLHNLIDFSLFEPGPMAMFALLAGSVIGARQPVMAAPHQHKLIGPAIALSAVSLLWLIAGGSLWLPTLLAESQAAEGDALLASAKPPRQSQAAFAGAAAYRRAAGEQTLNGDYRYRAARATLLGGGDGAAVRQLLKDAIAANPRQSKFWRLLADVELSAPTPDMSAVQSAFEKLLELDPANVEARLAYAQALERLGQKTQAARQYQWALHYNGLLPADEPKRLPTSRRAVIEQRAAAPH